MSTQVRIPSDSYHASCLYERFFGPFPEGQGPPKVKPTSLAIWKNQIEWSSGTSKTRTGTVMWQADVKQRQGWKFRFRRRSKRGLLLVQWHTSQSELRTSEVCYLSLPQTNSKVGTQHNWNCERGKLVISLTGNGSGILQLPLGTLPFLYVCLSHYSARSCFWRSRTPLDLVLSYG